MLARTDDLSPLWLESSSLHLHFTLLISFKTWVNSLEKQKTVTQHAQQDRLNNRRHLLYLFWTFSCLDNAISMPSKLG